MLFSPIPPALTLEDLRAGMTPEDWAAFEKGDSRPIQRFVERRFDNHRARFFAQPRWFIETVTFGAFLLLLFRPLLRVPTMLRNVLAVARIFGHVTATFAWVYIREVVRDAFLLARGRTLWVRCGNALRLRRPCRNDANTTIEGCDFPLLCDRCEPNDRLIAPQPRAPTWTNSIVRLYQHVQLNIAADACHRFIRERDAKASSCEER